MSFRLFHATVVLALVSSSALAADTAKKAPAAKAAAKAAAVNAPEPTHKNVPYGTHERQVLDVYLAKSDKPTPLVFYIHGGGWNGGDKNTASRSGLQQFLDAGISVVAINYRLVPQAQTAGIKPPVEWPLHDAARALQFTRSKAKEWNFDPQRIGATGGSAGACSSLWLAFHEDMADPNSADPIARESTRLYCAAVNGAQTSLDPKQTREWMPNMQYGPHAFGFVKGDKGSPSPFDQCLAARDSIMPWINEYSPYSLVSSNDPPVLLAYNAPIVKDQLPKDPTHSAIAGVKLAEKVHEVGGKIELVYPEGPASKYQGTTDYLIETLKQ